MKPTVVLGGGITGLALAFRLKERGLPVIVLEEAPTTGGCVRTFRSGGYVIEGGPSSILSKPATDRLLADLGLTSRVVASDPQAARAIVRRGRPLAIRPGPRAMFVPILSWPAKLRVLLDLVKGRGPEIDDESVHDFFVRRFGLEPATYLAGTFVSGIYAGDPRAISVRSAFPKLWEAERGYGVGVVRGFTKMRAAQRRSGIEPYKRRTLSLRGGLGELIEALRSRLGDAVVTDASVSRLERAGSAADGARLTVHVGERRYEAANVVATLPADRLGALLGAIAPGAAPPLAAIPTVSVTTVSLAFPTASFAIPPSGFGTLIPRGEGYRILGCLHMSSLFPERAAPGTELLTCFIGGALDPEAIRLSDGELHRTVGEEVARLTGAKGAGELLGLTRWERGIPQYNLGHHARLHAVERAVAGVDGMYLAGNWRDGVALADRIEKAEALAAEIAGA